jgi:NSS family neurotransmitter:Na+ symporter
MSDRPVFSSRWKTVFTMVGVAVGLGNAWRFPYMMGSYGGSAFLFWFLFFVFFLGIPAIAGEWALGRVTRKGPIGAFTQVLGRRGMPLGVMLFAVVGLADAYYLLVIGYIVYTASFALVKGFDDGHMVTYSEGMANGWLQYVITLVLLAITLWVLRRGLRKGIEQVSTFFIPSFALVVVVLIIYVLTMDGAIGHLGDFMKLDPDELKRPSTIFAAMGQAVFSLSLGGTFYVIYGSYLREDEKLPLAAVFTGLGDAGAALLASLFIVPAVLVFGLEMNQGPTLIFDTLPRLAVVMPAGRVTAALFLIVLGLVAFLSNLGALQVVLDGLMEAAGLSQGKALCWIGCVLTIAILPVALRPSLIGILDLVLGSGMQVFGSGAAILVLGFGLGRAKALKAIFGEEPPFYGKALVLWLRWVIPLMMLITLVLYIRSIS